MYSRSRDRVRFRESPDTEPDFGGKTLVRRWPGIVSPSAALCLRQSEFCVLVLVLVRRAARGNCPLQGGSDGATICLHRV